MLSVVDILAFETFQWVITWIYVYVDVYVVWISLPGLCWCS